MRFNFLVYVSDQRHRKLYPAGGVDPTPIGTSTLTQALEIVKAEAATLHAGDEITVHGVDFNARWVKEPQGLTVAFIKRSSVGSVRKIAPQLLESSFTPAPPKRRWMRR